MSKQFWACIDKRKAVYECAYVFGLTDKLRPVETESYSYLGPFSRRARAFDAIGARFGTSAQEWAVERWLAFVARQRAKVRERLNAQEATL